MIFGFYEVPAVIIQISIGFTITYTGLTFFKIWIRNASCVLQVENMSDDDDGGQEDWSLMGAELERELD